MTTSRIQLDRKDLIALLSISVITFLFLLGGLYLTRGTHHIDLYSMKTRSVEKYVTCFENYRKYHAITLESNKLSYMVFKCNYVIYKDLLGQITLFLFGLPIVSIGFLKTLFDTTEKMIAIRNDPELVRIHKIREVLCYLVLSAIFGLALYGAYIWLGINSATNIGKSIGLISVLLNLFASCVVFLIGFNVFEAIISKPSAISTTGTP